MPSLHSRLQAQIYDPITVKPISGEPELIAETLTTARIFSTDLSKSARFTSFIKKESSSLLTLLQPFSARAREYIFSLYNRTNKIISVSGPASLVTYLWPNGEPKSVAIFDSQLIVGTDSWHRSYPFLSFPYAREPESPLKAATSEKCLLNASFFPQEDKTVIDCPCTFITHNNHFGHFLLDDLPSFVSQGNLSRLNKSIAAAPFPITSGILNLLCSNAHPLPMPVIANSIIHFSDYSKSFITSHPAATFLALSYLKRTQTLRSIKSPPYVCLVRSGAYSTRLSNQSEIHALLTELGFTFIDPSTMSASELLATLNQTKVVVTEAGTSCLVAQLFSGSSTRVIALIPERLMLSPDDAMIASGLPYHLAIPSKLTFLTGITTSAHPVQSSDQAYYEPLSLRALVYRFR